MIILESAIAQSKNDTSDLRIKVDSIIKYEIRYIPDSTTNIIPKYKWDPEKHKGMYPCFSSLPINPMTLILLDGKKVKMESLNNYKLENISIVKVYPKNHKIAQILYGSAAKNGLIVLKEKK